jgi:hypothetical protein
MQGIDLLKLQIDHRAGVHLGEGGGAIRHNAARFGQKGGMADANFSGTTVYDK